MLCRPDQRLVCVLKACAFEVRHRIGLAPDHVIHDPEAGILKNSANAENIVIAADNPDRACIFQNAAAGSQPFMGEEVIGIEAVELVPVVGNAFYFGVIRTGEITAELQIVWRVCKDEIHRVFRHAVHHVDAITLDDHIFQRVHIEKTSF